MRGGEGLAQATTTPEQQNLYSRLCSIESDLSDASSAISNAESEVASTDASMGALPSRLASVRGRGYSALGHLDKTIELLTKKWAEVGPAVKASLANNLQPVGSQIGVLRADAATLRTYIDQSNLSAAGSLAGRPPRRFASEVAWSRTIPISRRSRASVRRGSDRNSKGSGFIFGQMPIQLCSL